MLAATPLPLQAVGGLSIQQALETIRRGASSIVVGAPLAIQPDRFAAGDEFEKVLAEVVEKTKEAAK